VKRNAPLSQGGQRDGDAVEIARAGVPKPHLCGFDGGTSPRATPVGSRCPPDSGGRCVSLPNLFRTLLIDDGLRDKVFEVSVDFLIRSLDQ